MNPYQTLGVRRNATLGTITRAYRKLILKHHPDRNPPGDETAKASYAAVSLAYEVLSNPDRRSKYDATGETAPERVHSALADIMSVLAPAFCGVVESIVSQGGDVRKENIVTHMTRVVTDNLKNLRKMIETQKKVRDALETAVSRVTMTKEDGKEEDVIAAAARTQALAIDARLKMMDAEAVRFTKALDYLKAYKYRTDASADVFGWGGFAKPTWSVT